MAEVIVFPDIEAIVGVYLRAELPARGFPGIKVVTRVPATRPDVFVKVRRVGGIAQDLVVDEATVAVEAYAATEPDAVRLAQVCRGLLHAAPSTDAPIYRVAEYAGPANLPDPTTAQVRYTATYAVRVRGTAE